MDSILTFLGLKSVNQLIFLIILILWIVKRFGQLVELELYKLRYVMLWVFQWNDI